MNPQPINPAPDDQPPERVLIEDYRARKAVSRLIPATLILSLDVKPALRLTS